MAPANNELLSSEGKAEGRVVGNPAVPSRILPRHKPLPDRLETINRFGVLLAFLLIGAALAFLRAHAVATHAQLKARLDAKMVAASVAGALAFNDRNSALGVLEGLAENKQITSAAVYRANGQRFVDYAVSHDMLGRLPRPGKAQQLSSSFWSDSFPDSLVVWEPVKTAWENVGWVTLTSDLRSSWTALYQELTFIAAVLLAVLLICSAWVSQLQRRMTEPLLRLVRTTKVIVEDRDYTLRAWKDAQDEVGSVADGLNHLLEEIQQRGRALHTAQHEVAESTREREASRVQMKQPTDENARQRTQLLANMCHEIRTPINRTLGSSAQLAATSLDDRQRDLLAASRSTTEYVLTIVDDVLDYTRIESGKLQLQEVEFDPSEMIEAVARMYRDRAQSKRITISTKIADSLPARVKGDPARLRQVIGSLIGNAIKFSQEGEITMELAAGDRQLSRVELIVSVRDNGIGIAEEAKARIFQAFSQDNDDLGVPSGSAGLGLSIARYLIRRMGGELTLSNEYGKGSGFRFSVYVEEIEAFRAREIPQQPITEKISEPAMAKPVALIIDNNQPNRKALKQILLKLGWEVEALDSLAALRNHHQLVRCAIVFVSADCLQADTDVLVTARLENLESSRKSVPVIATSSHDQNTPHLSDSLVDDRLAHPFRRKDVEAVLRRLGFNTLDSKSPPLADSHIAHPTVTKGRNTDDPQQQRDGEWMDQIVEVYLDSTKELVDRLTVAIERHESETGCAAARTLGSCSAKVGADRLAELCKEIDAAMQAQNFPVARDQVSALADEYKMVRHTLERGEQEPARASDAEHAHTRATV